VHGSRRIDAARNPAGSPINTLLGIMAHPPFLPLAFAAAKKIGPHETDYQP
jgi:hypothetical protein